jgi:hypothetical protein
MEAEAGGLALCLLPGIDMCNHAADAGARWVHSDVYGRQSVYSLGDKAGRSAVPRPAVAAPAAVLRPSHGRRHSTAASSGTAASTGGGVFPAGSCCCSTDSSTNSAQLTPLN